MSLHIRARFWSELALAVAGAALAVLTMLKRDWLEGLGIEPDGGDGGAEWFLATALLVIAVVSAAAARSEWRRVRPAAT